MLMEWKLFLTMIKKIVSEEISIGSLTRIISPSVKYGSFKVGVCVKRLRDWTGFRDFVQWDLNFSKWMEDLVYFVVSLNLQVEGYLNCVAW